MVILIGTASVTEWPEYKCEYTMIADKTSQMQKMSAAWIYVNGKLSSEPFLSFPIQKCLDKYIKEFD